ncbi:MAG TPA: hypothetical protein VHH53_09680 [Pseudonocardiaceae bacterium]|nr:hypothetical protein [Pseudonocardiaceae bacterium]
MSEFPNAGRDSVASTRSSLHSTRRGLGVPSAAEIPLVHSCHGSELR